MNIEAMSSDSRISAYAALPHVLVVDDDPTIRDLVSDYLGQHELRVSAVADGHAMQALLGAEVVDLIVLDLKLKGRSEEHTSELQSLAYLVCRLLLEKKKKLL